MATSADVTDINLKAYDVRWDNTDLGLTTVDSVTVNFGEQIIPVSDADQLAGVVKSFSTGFNYTVTANFKNTSFDRIFGKFMQNKAELVSDGTNDHYKVKNQNLDNRALAKVLILHPSSNSATNLAEDIYFPLAYPELPDAALAGSRDTVQEFSVTFQIFPDLDNDNEVARFGDWSATASDPGDIWIATGEKAQVPGMHLGAMDVEPAERQQMQAFYAFYSLSSTTCLLNDVAGLTATATSIPFDTLGSANAISVGDYLDLDDGANNERVRVTAVSYTSSTAGTLTVQRHVWGSNGNAGVTLVDNDVITLLSTPRIVNATDLTTWASSSASNVSVGTVKFASDATKTGVVAHVAAGSANITATGGATVSPNLVVTAN